MKDGCCGFECAWPRSFFCVPMSLDLRRRLLKRGGHETLSSYSSKSGISLLAVYRHSRTFAGSNPCGLSKPSSNFNLRSSSSSLCFSFRWSAARSEPRRHQTW